MISEVQFTLVLFDPEIDTANDKVISYSVSMLGYMCLLINSRL